MDSHGRPLNSQPLSHSSSTQSAGNVPLTENNEAHAKETASRAYSELFYSGNKDISAYNAYDYELYAAVNVSDTVNGQ